jgi:hypothetical protein
VTIDGWRPATLNQLMNRHHMQAHKLKKADARTLADAMVAGGVTAALGKRRVRLTVGMGPRERRPDPDSLFKSLLDGLVRAGALVDDGPKWCVLEPVVFFKSPSRCALIELEDID